MKVRFEVESDQIAMPAPNQFLVVFSEGDYIQIETGQGWVRRGAGAMRDLWRRLQKQEEAKKLVQIQQ